MSHIDRMIIEKKELDEKIMKLSEFLGNVEILTLSDIDCELLQTQRDLMRAYSKILDIRIRIDKEGK